MTGRGRGAGLRAMGKSASIAVVAAFCVMVFACTADLLDLLAFQVCSNDEAMLYLGYYDNGYGVARLGTTTGALEVFRETVSPENVNGCSVGIDPRPITADAPWPMLYFTSESPFRVRRTTFLSLEAPEDAFMTDPMDNANCLRVLEYTYLRVYWSTSSAINYCDSEGAGAMKLDLNIGTLISFDVDPATYRISHHRIYYLGVPELSGESYFGIYGTDDDGINFDTIVTIGHYVGSNLLFLNGYLYYVTQKPNGIYRIRADGTEPDPTLLLTPTAEPKAIAVDPDTGNLFWLEVDNSTPRRIMRSDAGQTAGTPLLENMPKTDPNGFFFYRP